MCLARATLSCAPGIIIAASEGALSDASRLQEQGALDLAAGGGGSAATAGAQAKGFAMVLATAVIAAIGVVILALQHTEHARAAARRLGMVLAIGASIALVLAAAPLAVQFLGPYRPTGRLVPGDVVVTDAGAFLMPASRQLLRFPGLSADPWTLVTEDSGAYIGLPVMLLLSWPGTGFAARRRRFAGQHRWWCSHPCLRLARTFPSAASPPPSRCRGLR